jgi:hypothetical protein
VGATMLPVGIACLCTSCAASGLQCCSVLDHAVPGRKHAKRLRRKRLRALPELEREMELSKRSEQRDQASFRQMLTEKDKPEEKGKARARPKRAAARRPRKVAPVLDDDDFERAGGTSEEDGVRMLCFSRACCPRC